MKATFAALLILLVASLVTTPAHALIVLAYHDVRDEVDGNLDPDRDAISTAHLIEHFEWLRSHGYRVVSLDEVMAARAAATVLSDKSVLLTFDDGLRSAYTRVLPLLRAYRYPAVVAVVTSWLDLPSGQALDYGGRKVSRDAFLSAAQIRELGDSGLVEIASHSDALHRAVVGNPQGGQMPAAATRIWDASTGYESETAFRRRIRTDLARSAAQIQALAGRRPRAIVWPYGATSAVANRIAEDLGMSISFSLAGRDAATGQDRSVPRVLLDGNPDAERLAWELRHPAQIAPVRAVQVDLDYVYDADPQQQARNLDLLVERIRKLGVNQVWLQTYADPDGDGSAAEVYFPNRHLPMRADLYSRVAWQLRTRDGVDVYAWLPVLAFRLPDAARQRRLEIVATGHAGRGDPTRLDPFLGETRALVGDIYEDLAVAGFASGLLFGDDAVLRDDDGLAAAAPPPGSLRTQALVDFTRELEGRAERWRPNLKTVRNLFAQPVLDPAAQNWTAQSLPAFVSAYDAVALLAMPELENVGDGDAWLRALARHVLDVPGAAAHTVFELQARDWRSGQPIGASVLSARIRELQIVGARHFAYYPDDFLHDEPAAATLRRTISASDFPYPKP